MIVSAHTNHKPVDVPLPIFDVIAATHRERTEKYRVVTQPDHAILSGKVAAALDRRRFPFLDEELLEGIAYHDSGWFEVDGAAPSPKMPPTEADGKLRSFLTTSPEISLGAWSRSIDGAVRIGARAGSMVSRHFATIAQYRLNLQIDGPEDVQRLQDFLRRESARNAHLGPGNSESGEALRVLQFCDQISLYLSCGSRQAAVFPMRFGDEPVQVQWRGESVEIRNVSLSPVEVTLPAYEWRSGSDQLRFQPIGIDLRSA
ncbi:MAG TPA: DUF3891 family protein [Terriglobales bacterium]